MSISFSGASTTSAPPANASVTGGLVVRHLRVAFEQAASDVVDQRDAGTAGDLGEGRARRPSW